MSHCQERITKDMGLAYTEKCGKCQEVGFTHFISGKHLWKWWDAWQATALFLQDTKNLKGVSSYSYIMKPLDNGIQIKEASVHELIQFSPFSEQHGAAHMETKYVHNNCEYKNWFKEHKWTFFPHSRQSLMLLEVRTPTYAPTTPPPLAQYSHRGNLTYQFSTELLQLPILLLNINDIESQVLS